MVPDASKNFWMVFALAGDSTMTRVVAIADRLRAPMCSCQTVVSFVRSESD